MKENLRDYFRSAKVRARKYIKLLLGDEQKENETIQSGEEVRWDAYARWENEVEQINVAKAWGRLEKDIDKKRYFFHRTWFKAAASVAIVMFGAWSLWIIQPTIDTSVENTIIRDTASVYLTMDNGESISLSDSVKNEIKETDGTEIKRTVGAISYLKKRSVDAFKVKSQVACYNTINVPRGANYKITLSDGTTVELNSESKLKYPVQFNGKRRMVTLTGEAYFDVTHTGKPFVVNVNGVKVFVLGTEFNVRGYQDESNIETTLVEGKVRVKAPNMNPVVLKPNQQAKVNQEKESLSVQKVNASRFIAWRKGVFIFQNTKLVDVMRTLQRWYNIEVEYETEAIKNIEFGGTLSKHVGFDQVVDMFDQIDEIEVRIEGNKVKFLTNK
ncbi:DUF4974 domain-containing protein [Prolixibacteraceae bacterium JC049]|nr:DUF4974 domain-containing protein [Prolixibacteraceae bacterium JC049]